MPENTSNSLYQNIQSTAQDIKNAYANMPTFTTNVQQGVVGNDQVLNSNINDYSSAVNELFAHDKAMASSNTTPSFAQGVEGYVSNPMTAEKYDAEMFAQKGERVASSLNRMEKRKAFLGDLVDKAVKLYEAGIQGKKYDYEAAQNEFNNALKAADLAETKRHNLAGEKGNSNTTGVPEVDAMSDSQIQAEFIKKYGANAYSKIGGTQADRIAAARTLVSIVKSGGDFNAEDLMSDSQLKARDAAEQLLSKVLYAENHFTGKSGFGGTGIETGAIPSVFATKNVKELRTAIASISPEKIKELSGVAVSDKEFDRLSDLLPSKWQPEAENLRRITEMKKILQIGMEMQNKAAMENITLDKAYEKYGKPAYEKYGVEWKLGGSSSEGDWE